MLDTNVVIALMNANRQIAERLRRHEQGSVAVSTVVMHELYYGAYRSQRVDHNLRKLAQLRFPVLGFNLQDADHAGRIRAQLAKQGLPIGPYDVLIAAQALTRELTLVTHNVREFARVEGLTLEDWL